MLKKIKEFVGDYSLEIIWVMIIGVWGRLLPHVPNMTPIVGLSILVGVNLSRSLSIAVMVFTLLISDISLTLFLSYPLVGYFTLFTYSGIVMVTLASASLGYSKKTFPFYVLGASSYFWIWTNLGVWLTSGLYARTVNGLWSCYYMALPFLRNGLIGDLIWGYLIFAVFDILLKRKVADGKELRCCRI